MGRQELARESQGPVLKLVSRGKGTCGVREDSDCSVKVCVDLVVGTDGVLKGRIKGDFQEDTWILEGQGRKEEGR